MKNFVFAVMILAFFMGLDYAVFDRVAKNCDEDPWEDVDYHSAKVSQDEYRPDPREQLNESVASQKKYEASEWFEDCD